MIRSYASYFVSFLLSEVKNVENIKSIILFGSAARNEADGDSDVDIFIEVFKKNKKFDELIYKFLQKYYISREALIFKSNKIDNKINLIIGLIDEWKDLKESIESTGIVLYGNYKVDGVNGKKYSIIYWDLIKINRGAFLNKIYGFSVKNKRYKGLLEINQGRRIGKSCIMIPSERTKIFSDLIKKHQVNAKILQVYHKGS